MNKAILAVVLLINACTLQPRPAELNIYVLQAKPRLAEISQPGNQLLLLGRARAEAGFDTARIAYSEHPSQLSYYSQSEWADRPARLLVPLLAEAIEQAGLFRAVLTQPTSVQTDMQLDIELIRLVQDFNQQPSQVQLTIRTSLSNMINNTLIASRLFDIRQTAPSEDAYGAVQAANQAVSQWLLELINWLQQHRNKPSSDLGAVGDPPTPVG